MEEFDYETGRLLDVLDELKLSENTLVIYTADNGPWGYTLSVFWGDAGPLRNGKGEGDRLPCRALRMRSSLPSISCPPSLGCADSRRPRTVGSTESITDLLMGKTEKRPFTWASALEVPHHFYGYAREDDRPEAEELYNLKKDIGERKPRRKVSRNPCPAQADRGNVTDPVASTESSLSRESGPALFPGCEVSLMKLHQFHALLFVNDPVAVGSSGTTSSWCVRAS